MSIKCACLSVMFVKFSLAGTVTQSLTYSGLRRVTEDRQGDC